MVTELTLQSKRVPNEISQSHRLIIFMISFLPFSLLRKEIDAKRDQNFIDTYPHCPVRLGTDDQKRGIHRERDTKNRKLNWVFGSMWLTKAEYDFKTNGHLFEVVIRPE